MKGLFCGKCFTIRSLPSGDFKPVSCDCGNLSGWWLDAVKGVARYHAKDRHDGYMVGWNNTYLLGVVERHLTDTNEDARALHDACTDAPGYMFDKTKKNCWSIIVRPGATSDTAWATPTECIAVGVLTYSGRLAKHGTPENSGARLDDTKCVIVNGMVRHVAAEALTYMDILGLAGQRAGATVTWANRITNASGILYAGQSIPVQSGLIFDATETNQA